MSRTTLSRLLATLCFSVACLVTSPQSPLAAEGSVNFGLDGAAWKRVLSDKDPQNAKLYKLILLRGVLDGMMFGQSPYTAPGSNALYTNTSYEHLIAALDQFYADYRNEKVIVVWALLVVSMELRGEPRSKIDAVLSDYRRRAADVTRERVR